MAAPRKTTTAKKEVTEQVEAQETVETPEVKQTVRKQKKKLNRDDLILIMNSTAGRLVHTSRKTGQEWLFTEYGQTDEMELGELVTLNNSSPAMLREPWLLILDEDAVEYLGLKKLYENILTEEEMEEFFNASVEQMEALLEKLPKGMKELVAGLAKKKVENGTLDSISKIKLIEEKLKVTLND
ncbi:hypothetical protein [Priestia megaterium]|uniref:hypothetical protein n=1 Tax=Priestia megaterium TaxID=1404 RepID=UPI003CC5555A